MSLMLIASVSTMSDKNMLRVPRTDGSDYYEFRKALELITMGGIAAYDEVLKRYGPCLE